MWNIKSTYGWVLVAVTNIPFSFDDSSTFFSDVSFSVLSIETCPTICKTSLVSRCILGKKLMADEFWEMSKGLIWKQSNSRFMVIPSLCKANSSLERTVFVITMLANFSIMLNLLQGRIICSGSMSIYH